ncbi:MAG: aldehyde dehydrogenase family protein [Candidatus Thermoplasmatota archaeon]|nr:aldehyde dehydrogenase family protein [Candidatus Thermoplasmatota archaeon]
MEYKMLIDGGWTEAASGRRSGVIDPSTEEAIATVPRASREDARAAIDAARDSFDGGPWPQMRTDERGDVLERLARLLEENAEEFASLEALNGGKPIRQASFGDIPMAIEHTRYFAQLAKTLGEEVVELPDIGIKSRVLREPIGVCTGIIPWNYPLLMAVWKIAPALAAGNTVILKPATYTPLTALEYARLAMKAGVPSGVLNVVTGSGSEVGEELVSNPKVDRVAFTGSTEVGRKVMAMAASTVKKVTLELGGKAPMVVLEDADMEEAIRGTLFGAFLHQGQVCLSGTRLLLPSSLHDSFLKRLIEKTKSLRLGPTSSWETDLGPLISESQREGVEGYIAGGLGDGARLVHGGRRPEGLERGFYLEPTIFDDVTSDMTIAREEIFGPVLSIFAYDGPEEAVDLANATTYGLAASVWSSDLKRAEEVARRIRAGTVWVNHHHILSCAAPHGGYGQSGIGRELGIWGLHEYTELKHLFLDESGEAMKDAFGLVSPE